MMTVNSQYQKNKIAKPMKSLGTSTIDARVFEKKKTTITKEKCKTKKEHTRKETQSSGESQTRKEKKKKNRALTTEKKGKIEKEYSQIETVRLLFFLFSFFCRQPVEVEQWWRSNGGGDREREKRRFRMQRQRQTERLTA